jgi:hypothetical protein
MVTVEKFTNNGHKVSVNVWKSKTLNFEIFIDGKMYDSGSSYIDFDEDEYSEATSWATAMCSEATSWATAMCADIEKGIFVEKDGVWGLANVDNLKNL